MNDQLQSKIKELQTTLDSLKNSREFRLGMQLRQNWFFKRVRHFRLKDRMVQICIQGEQGPSDQNPETWILGIWSEEFPAGMPLELLERDVHKWLITFQEKASNNQVLYTNQKAGFVIYSKDGNLRLDIMMRSQDGQIEVKTPDQKKKIKVQDSERTTLSIYPNRHPIEIIASKSTDTIAQEAKPQSEKFTRQWKLPFTKADEQWLARQGKNPSPLSINNPEWKGILASASELFENIYPIPDNLDADQALYYARLFKEANCPSITIQGFPKTYVHLIKAVQKLAPKLPIFVIYHGNFIHMREDYDWRVLQLIKKLHDEGEITKIGFVKMGMAELMAEAGLRSAFIMNRVRQIPASASEPLPDGIHIGIWGQPDWSWKKSPYAMLASLKLVPDSLGHVYNVSPRAKEFGDLFSISAEYHHEAIPQNQVPGTLTRMHLNLYVTLTECAPMLPLESLSVGSPCLFGPASHYFLDHQYLHRQLVVPHPDDARMISQYTNQALAERGEIIDAYRDYAPAYNHRALQALSEFLDYPLQEAG